jgi:hypothetical protein
MPSKLRRRPLYTFALDADLRAALRQIKERDGISESEQIRRGIRLWLKQRRALTTALRASVTRVTREESARKGRK